MPMGISHGFVPDSCMLHIQP